MNILDKIVEHKRQEVAGKKAKVSIDELQLSDQFARKTLSLKKFLLEDNKTGIIAEFKRRSPSKGIINADADVVKVTTAYASNGASGLSVLTDEYFFGGSMNDLLKARVNNTPILRKDFMVDEYQFYEAKSIGADVVLLIAACLTPQQVKQFATLSKQLGLEVLLEIHNEEELKHICDEVDMVGVNNRNLKTFEVDINTSFQLFDKIPQDKPAVAESGISNVDTIITLKKAGFKGFLIGENFMKQKDPASAFEDFATNLKSTRI
ncbi:MAG: indole-3-glycerol phosphate synthase TrpC [Ilyomonas sp.]